MAKMLDRKMWIARCWPQASSPSVSAMAVNADNHLCRACNCNLRNVSTSGIMWHTQYGIVSLRKTIWFSEKLLLSERLP
eukprot:2707713-Amphidinium_carterae.1